MPKLIGHSAMKKKILTLLVVGTMMLTSLTACSKAASTRDASKAVIESQSSQIESVNVKTASTAPKYVFLFIGDGMSYPQIQLANYYLSASENAKNNSAKKVTVDGKEKTILESKNQLNMMNFPVTGSAQTFDSTSFAPDSASAATSIATGNKTWSNSINMSQDFTKEYETIAEQLKAQKNYKIGIISSVNLNHATPAAFYAHQKSRDNYYEIGLELVDSNFDYFAGGALRKPTGDKKDQKNLYTLASEKGYKVVRTEKDAKALTSQDGKAIVIGEKLADSDSMPYNIDRKDGEWTLSDYVEKGIEVLNNDTGFFMMVEGGKIDWSCHANDAASAISDTIELDESVEKAINFYQQHPNETLIIVTGDHETGGLTIGYAGTNYDTFLPNLENQKISFAKFDAEYVTAYKANKTSFDDVMKDVDKLFGLKAPTEAAKAKESQTDNMDLHPESTNDGSLVMTQYEYDNLQEAYRTTLERTGKETEYDQEEYVKYGSYQPLTVTITHILDHKSGINFGSYSHTGLPVEVLAQGVGAENFKGYYDNTNIYRTLADLEEIK